MLEHLKERKILLSITFSVFVLGFSIAHAMTPNPQVAAVSQTQSPRLIVGSEQAFPPFSTGMTDATAGGFTVELWKAVAAEAGLNYSIRVLPFHEILQEFKDGKIDVLINLAKSDERKAFADFTVPHVIVNGGIFVRKNQSKVHVESDLVDQSIIVLKADLAHDYAVSKGLGKELVLVDTIEKGLRLLASGKHDAMLLSKIAGLQSLKSTGISNLEVLKVNVGFSQKFSFAVQKGQSELLSKLNEGLAITKTNDTYTKVYEKWFGVYEDKSDALIEILMYLMAPTLLLLGLSLYFYFSRKIERKKSDDEMKIAAIAFETQEGMMVTDVNSIIIRVNKAFTKITGFSAEEAIGKSPNQFNSGRQSDDFYLTMWGKVQHDGFWEGEVWNRRKNGEIYPEHLTITAVKDAKGITTNYVATLNDITMSKAASEEIKNLAFYDSLTQLPNRRLLLERLDRALVKSNRSGQYGGLLFLDLDNFKILNDTLGHDVGDVLLKQVAIRLGSCVRESDTVARLGGDEFIVLLEELSTQDIEAATQTREIAQKIFSSLNQPYELTKYTHHSTSSIGVILFNGHEHGVDELLKKADIAMYHAKTEGRNTLRFFDPNMQEVITERAEMENALRSAIKKNQFELYYQMQVDRDGLAIGAEALIRWHHPDRGVISPFSFIPLAEDTGLILPIGQWVLETACAQLTNWKQNQMTQDLSISINVSAKQLFQSDFVKQVQTTIQRYDINPKLLKIELTESMLVDNINDIIIKMDELSKAGISFSLDDFGTGYSSLQYLKKLPLSQLKIDQSFVRDIATDNSDRAIVRTIITMASSLGVGVIAEGVEKEEQRQYLLENGCSFFQGYLYSMPLPIDLFEKLLSNN